MENNNDLQSIIDSTIEYFRTKSFIPKWEKHISELIEDEEIRINSLVIGKVGELPDRIYVGANTNKLLVFDFDGTYLDTIEIDEGDEIIKLVISDVAENPHIGNELIIQTSNDSILFYGINNKGDYQKLQYPINYS